MKKHGVPRHIRLFLLLIRIYQRLLSPLLGYCCRFEPTCSEYAREALERHGVVRGLGLTILRLRRCRPGYAGGDDPVPGEEYFHLPVFPRAEEDP